MAVFDSFPLGEYQSIPSASEELQHFGCTVAVAKEKGLKMPFLNTRIRLSFPARSAAFYDLVPPVSRVSK